MASMTYRLALLIRALVLLGVGGFICVLNFYLSFLRYPLHRWRGGTREDYRWESGLPLLGSAFVAWSLFWLHKWPVLLPVGVLLILIDTGGIHWMLGVVLWHEVLTKPKVPDDSKPQE